MKTRNILRTVGLLVAVLVMGCSEDKIEDGATGTITGIVVANGTNEPLENVKISTQPVTTTIFTLADGTFTINNVLVGDYSVQADIDGFVTSFEAASVTAGRESNVIFELLTPQVDNTPPETPVAVSPENNAQNLALNLDLIWTGGDSDPDDTVTYNITLQNDQNSEILEFQTVNDTMINISEGLTFSTKYFWQISASDGVNDPVQSVLNTFETTSVPNAEYLFVRKVGDNNVIFGSDFEGNLVQLTSDTNNSWRPRKSSATGKIAYLQSVGANTHIFTMNPDGSNKNQISNAFPVTGFNLNEIDFTWTPAGDRLVYPNFDKLFIINSDGTGAAGFFQAAGGSFITEVDWSEFNDVIAVKTNNAAGYDARIFTMQPDGTVINEVLSGLPGAVGGLSLNVDGSRLIYTYDISGVELTTYRPQDSRLFIYSADTDTATQILTGVDDGFLNLDPRFSPNENEVIYVQKGRAPGAVGAVFLFNLTSTEEDGVAIIPNATMPDWENN